MGNVIPVEIEDELKSSYLNYAMSVIVSRAIPDVRDGLKPVHRRILFAMEEMGLHSNRPYKKCGRIVGDVLGKYHPHGDAAIYETLVRMAQTFSLRYISVDGHGNFGSVDGDPPAAMRYTEARMSKIAELMLKDINKETVNYGPNYDDSMTEPLVLPAAIPYLLINGTSGIAVGMATNIPPYNINEVVKAIVAQIENPEITIEEIGKIITGPDFPTGGIIFGKDGIKKALKTGRGHITIRAKLTVEETKNGKEMLIVKELPYQVNKANLIEKIANLVKDDKLQGIAHIQDESDREGMRIVIELKKNIIPKIVINQLFRHTELQINYGIINLALDNGIPKVLNIKDTIQAYINFRMEIIYRRSRYELKKAEERSHIVQGLLIALDNIDEVIKTIRNSKDTEDAKTNLMSKFGLSEIQAHAIVEMRLRQLTNLESTKLKEEYEELQRTIARLKEIISSDRNVLVVVRDELVEDTRPFIDERKTEIVDSEIENFEIEDLIQKENMVVTITHRGFIKRMSVNEFRSQSKGGVGVSSSSLRDDDFVEHIFIASTHDYVLFFTNKGLLYQIKVHEIPQLSKNARGETIKMLFGISANEEVNAVVNVKGFNDESLNVFIATKHAIVKKVALKEFENKKQNGKRAIFLDENDDVVDVKITDGKKEIILATRRGKSLRIHEETVRIMGRAARGIRGIRLEQGDELCGLCVVDENSLMLLVTENGFAKRLDFDLFAPHGRGTGGQRYYKYSDEKGEVVGIKQVSEGDDIMAITSKGQIIKIPTEQISQQGKNAGGIRLVRITKPDFVVAIAKSPKPQEEKIPE
jgi:DNA gyrase subunit A